MSKSFTTNPSGIDITLSARSSFYLYMQCLCFSDNWSQSLRFSIAAVGWCRLLLIWNLLFFPVASFLFLSVCLLVLASGVSLPNTLDSGYLSSLLKILVWICDMLCFGGMRIQNFDQYVFVFVFFKWSSAQIIVLKHYTCKYGSYHLSGCPINPNVPFLFFLSFSRRYPLIILFIDFSWDSWSWLRSIILRFIRFHLDEDTYKAYTFREIIILFTIDLALV